MEKDIYFLEASIRETNQKCSFCKKIPWNSKFLKLFETTRICEKCFTKIQRKEV